MFHRSVRQRNISDTAVFLETAWKFICTGLIAILRFVLWTQVAIFKVFYWLGMGIAVVCGALMVLSRE